MTMTINNPAFIGSRLLPAVKVGPVTISIDRDDDDDDRNVFRYFFDGLPGGQYTDNDLKSGLNGSTIQEAFASLLSLLAFGDSEMWPRRVNDWREAYSDELSMLQAEFAETENIIEEK